MRIFKVALLTSLIQCVKFKPSYLVGGAQNFGGRSGFLLQPSDDLVSVSSASVIHRVSIFVELHSRESPNSGFVPKFFLNGSINLRDLSLVRG